MNQQTDEISLKELIDKIKEWFNYLCSQWKVILIAAIIGAAIGLAYSFSKKPVYKAALTFELQGGDVAGLSEVFKSRSMIEQTLLAPVAVGADTVSLAEMYIRNKGYREQWNAKPQLKNIQFLPNTQRTDFTRAQDSILGVLYQDLSTNNLTVAQKDKKVPVTTMDVVATNELFAKSFSEALSQKVFDFYINYKSKKARKNVLALQRQTDSIRGLLYGSTKGVTAVATDNTFNVDPALNNVLRSPSVRRQLDVQANFDFLTELVKQTELAKVTLRDQTPLIEVFDKPILPLPKEKFGKAKGIVIGGMLAGFLMVMGLMVSRILKMI